MNSAKKFIKVMKVVLDHPGWRQTAIKRLSKLNKTDVSRLCALGVEEEIFEKKGNEYYEGAFIQKIKVALLNLLKEEK